ncbi:MAG: helix-turn-helix transcriptional regulator [Ruminococcaceae bacterium]|nr:helix-turn-helix transcriptional regulator [Oscillospiraceae bacterium]
MPIFKVCIFLLVKMQALFSHTLSIGRKCCVVAITSYAFFGVCNLGCTHFFILGDEENEKEIESKAKNSVRIMSMLLKELREQRGYTIEEAAQVTGFSEKAIINYESSALDEVAIDVLNTYCQKMNCDFCKLLSCVWEITTNY